MQDPTGKIVVRVIGAGSPDHHLALHRALGTEVPRLGPRTAREVAELLHSVRHHSVSVDLLLGAYLGDELVSACVAVESPGAAALVLMPDNLVGEVKYEATVLALRAIQPAAWQRSVALLEVLVAPGREAVSGALGAAGFCNLTRLLYLDRREVESPGPVHPADDLEWVRYSPDLEHLFETALESTYAQTMDCPEVTTLRRTADVLAGHRATGIFDPALWWVALRRTQPAGVILLNRIANEPALELVYMGVAQVARGTGVADALLQRGVEAAKGIGATLIALAVDERNTPARRLYARWGFVQTGVRDVWIASPP